MKIVLTLTVLVVLTACSARNAQAQLTSYQVDYDVTFQPEAGVALVKIRWGQGAERIRQLSLRTHERMSHIESNASFSRDGGYLVMGPAHDGMELSYRVRINHKRANGDFDARMTPTWVLWRGDDLIPAGKLKQKKNTEAEAHLTLRGPEGWSFRTPYQKLKDGRYRIENPDRSFDRPTGWMIGGEIGVRTDTIAGVTVTVAAPQQQDVRRMDILAFLSWTLPALAEVMPNLPDRLLLVSAKDGMWRGGLSAGNSLYLHADRPLISENGTSTVLHELVHVVSGLDSIDGADWIVEGLAEYYSVKLLQRSGTITLSRRDRAMAELRQWSSQAGPLNGKHSTGPTTAKAAVLMEALDKEITQRTGGEHSLDDVFAALANDKTISVEKLRSVQKRFTGQISQVLNL
ncbi:MAG: hypothetical protein AB8B96_20535 [Lysobacterales bacterium]